MKLKLMPVNVYDIAKTQSYLRDMALKGYFLKKLDTFAYFEKGEPVETTYRLEPLMRDEIKPKEEQLAHYESYGWDYICTITKAFHVYKTNKKDFTEIHTDPITQSYAYEYINKKLKFLFIISIVLLPLSVLSMLYPVLFGAHPVVFAVKFDNVSFKFMMLLSAFVTLDQVVSSRRKINLLLNRLRTGSEMSQKSSYKSNYTPYIFHSLIIFFSVFTIFVSFIMLTTGWEKNLSEYNNSLPTIRLTDIETAQGFEIENELYKSDYISYDWTELAPAIYEINEKGIVRDQMWEDQSGEYSPSLSTEFFELRFGFLGQALLEDLIDDELEFFRFRSIVYQELIDTDFDKAVFIQVNETQMFFGILDKNVIYIRYHGYEDLSAHFDEIYENIRNFKLRIT